MLRIHVGLHEEEWERIRVLTKAAITSPLVMPTAADLLAYEQLNGRIGQAKDQRNKAVAKIQAKRTLQEYERQKSKL